MKNVNKFYLS